MTHHHAFTAPHLRTVGVVTVTVVVDCEAQVASEGENGLVGPHSRAVLFVVLEDVESARAPSSPVATQEASSPNAPA